MTETKVDLITGLTFELTADGTAVQESTDPNFVVKEFSDDVEQIAQQIFKAMRFSAQRVNEPQPPEWVPKGNSLMQDHAREVARAVLARWGRPAPVPVPVSERLPGAEDCASWPDDPDTQPWCWLGNVVDGGWEWHQRSPGILTFIRDSYTHWLPAHALPLPAREVQP